MGDPTPLKFIFTLLVGVGILAGLLRLPALLRHFQWRRDYQEHLQREKDIWDAVRKDGRD